MSINDPQYPNWNGLTPSNQRTDRQMTASPDGEDHDQIIAELLAHQTAIQAGGGSSEIANGTAVTATDTADKGERILYDPSGGTFTLNAPASPTIGERWAVKNFSADLAAITISGNGSNIEDPTGSFALASSFSLSGNGIAAEWEYTGTEWVVI